MRVQFQSTIHPPWTEMAPVRVGSVPVGLGTPGGFLTIKDDHGTRLRVDVYGSDNEAYAFTDFQSWLGFVVLGWGEHLYLVQFQTKTAVELSLGSYFGHMYPGDGYLLVASAEDLSLVQPDGEILWTSLPLGIDGVIVEEVDNGVISGGGEWDPPGGWRPFRLSLASGQLLEVP